MIDRLQPTAASPLSTSIIATVRRDKVSLGQNNQQDQISSQSAGNKNTDNVFRLRPQVEPEQEQPQSDFAVTSEDTIFQAQTSANNAPNAKLPANAFGLASEAYRLASSFTAFPAFSQLNFAV